MAIPWLIGAAVVGVVGVVSAALSDDDSSSSARSDSRELERERAKAESERKEKRAQAERDAKVRKIAEQNQTHANRFINKYSLSISADSLVKASKNDNLEVTAIQVYQLSGKPTKRVRQIEQISKQLEEMKRLENDLINL